MASQQQMMQQQLYMQHLQQQMQFQQQMEQQQMLEQQQMQAYFAQQQQQQQYEQHIQSHYPAEEEEAEPVEEEEEEDHEERKIRLYNEKKKQLRRLVFSCVRSSEQLDRNATMVYEDPESIKRPLISENEGMIKKGKRVGDPTMCILHELKVLSVTWTGLQPIMLKTNLTVGNSRYNDGKVARRGILSVPGASGTTTFGPKGLTVGVASASILNPLHNFMSGIDRKQLKSTMLKITRARKPHEQHPTKPNKTRLTIGYQLPEGHAVLSVLRNNPELIPGDNSFMHPNPNGHRIASSIAKRILDTIDTKILQHIPYVDMSRITVSAEPLLSDKFADVSTMAGVGFDGLSDLATKITHSLHVVMEASYIIVSAPSSNA